MKLVITKHAKERFKERKIPLSLVYSTFDRYSYQYIKLKEKEKSSMFIPLENKKICHVVLLKESDYYVVITVIKKTRNCNYFG